MQYLVTGGAGFIGSNIVEELLKKRETVRILDNFSTGKRENIKPFLNDIELVEGDLRDPDAVLESVKNVDVVFHQGALASVPRSIEDPIATHEVNVTGTLNLFQAARAEGVRRIICASSSSIYGKDETVPKLESYLPRPLSPYATSKIAMEYYAQAYYEAWDLDVVCLRYFNVFGPRQDPKSEYAAVIPKFINIMMDGKTPIIYGDGLQSRDFSYITNVVNANLLAAQAEGIGGMVLNAACNERYTVNDLVKYLNSIMGLSVKPEYSKTRPGDVRHSHADISLAKKHLNYEPTVTFYEGLQKVVKYYAEMRKK